MRRWLAVAVACVGLALMLPLMARAKGGNAQRGRYLVRGVAMCNDCHTPRDERGEPDLRRELHGAALPFEPAVEMPWAPAAPSIAGLPKGWGEAALVKLLMTGRGLEGKPLNPPMPQFRMSREDAESVVAYLKSLSPPEQVTDRK